MRSKPCHRCLRECDQVNFLSQLLSRPEHHLIIFALVATHQAPAASPRNPGGSMSGIFKAAVRVCCQRWVVGASNQPVSLPVDKIYMTQQETSYELIKIEITEMPEKI